MGCPLIKEFALCIFLTKKTPTKQQRSSVTRSLAVLNSSNVCSSGKGRKTTVERQNCNGKREQNKTKEKTVKKKKERR